MKRFILFAVVYIAAWGCVEEERVLPESIIPEEVQPFYDSFFYEAELRGVYLEQSPVEIMIVEDLDAGGRKNCGQKTILFPDHLFNWGHEDNRINTEYNVFHELGHYYLGRNHLNELNKDGRAKSIMHWHKRAYSVSSSHLREQALNELFSQYK